ncbi:gluconokinase [Salinisphaera sp. USBA-960]|nr:gluconokinase [Salifodinibacter halophilus]NNC25414.1 gluconokinase [Salifodinibacter halophilus]
MGVTGCGKTSVGTALGAELGVTYVDGDQLHSVESIAKMARGEALTDADRWPWLDRVGAQLGEAAKPLIVGCSALKRAYRDAIRERARAPVLFIHLTGDRDMIAERISLRDGHFMPVALVDSQFVSLEPPAPDESAITANIAHPQDVIVGELVRTIEIMQREDQL